MVRRVKFSSPISGNFKRYNKPGFYRRDSIIPLSADSQRLKIEAKGKWLVLEQVAESGWLQKGDIVAQVLVGDSEKEVVAAYQQLGNRNQLVVPGGSLMLTDGVNIPCVDETSQDLTFENAFKEGPVWVYSIESVRVEKPYLDLDNVEESLFGRQFYYFSATEETVGNERHALLTTVSDRAELVSNLLAYIAVKGGMVGSLNGSVVSVKFLPENEFDRLVLVSLFYATGIGNAEYFTRLAAINGFSVDGSNYAAISSQERADRYSGKVLGFDFYDSSFYQETNANESVVEKKQEKVAASSSKKIAAATGIALIAVLLCFLAVRTGAFGWFASKVLTKLPLPAKLKNLLSSLKYKDNWFHRYHEIQIEVNGELVSVEPYFKVVADSEELWLGNRPVKILDYDVYNFLTIDTDAFGEVYVHRIEYDRQQLILCCETRRGEEVKLDTNGWRFVR